VFPPPYVTVRHPLSAGGINSSVCKKHCAAFVRSITEIDRLVRSVFTVKQYVCVSPSPIDTRSTPHQPWDFVGSSSGSSPCAHSTATGVGIGDGITTAIIRLAATHPSTSPSKSTFCHSLPFASFGSPTLVPSLSFGCSPIFVPAGDNQTVSVVPGSMFTFILVSEVCASVNCAPKSSVLVSTLTAT